MSQEKNYIKLICGYTLALVVSGFIGKLIVAKYGVFSGSFLLTFFTLSVALIGAGFLFYFKKASYLTKGFLISYFVSAVILLGMFFVPVVYKNIALVLICLILASIAVAGSLYLVSKFPTKFVRFLTAPILSILFVIILNSILLNYSLFLMKIESGLMMLSIFFTLLFSIATIFIKERRNSLENL